MNLNALKTFDWQTTFKKLANPHAASDFNAFLEAMPQNTSKTALIVAGTVWAVSLSLCLLVAMQMQNLTELRADLQDAEAAKPSVPRIQNTPVGGDAIKDFVKSLSQTYTGLEIKAKGSTIEVEGDSTSKFGQFREAIGHIQNGGSGWRVNVDTFCVGRECDDKPLHASLNINKVSVEAPK